MNGPNCRGFIQTFKPSQLRFYAKAYKIASAGGSQPFTVHCFRLVSFAIGYPRTLPPADTGIYGLLLHNDPGSPWGRGVSAHFPPIRARPLC